MRCLTTLVLMTALVSAPAFAESLRLSAKPGAFNAKALGVPASEVAFGGTGKLLSFNASSQWPAAAYIGIFQGPDRNNSVQVLAIRNKPTDDYLVIGYRLVVDGKETKVDAIANVPLDHSMRVHIHFKNSVTYLQINDEKIIKVNTPFKKVAPYVSVSSGEAEFSVDL